MFNQLIGSLLSLYYRTLRYTSFHGNGHDTDVVRGTAKIVTFFKTQGEMNRKGLKTSKDCVWNLANNGANCT